MKQSRFILLFFAIASISQFNFCSLQRQVQISPQQSADRLTQESYISPEMQWAILSFLGAQDATINIKTGNAIGIPSINQLLTEIRNRMNSSINFATKQSIKNALHAMIEATDIALFVASVEAAHRDQKYILYQNIDAQLGSILDAQKQTIQNTLAELNAREVFDEPTKSSSYFSWFFPTMAEMNNPGHVPPVHFNHNQDTVTFSKDMMEAIIKKNNYKIEQKADAKKAANILFKQCFIAQQHHLKDTTRIEKLKINLHSPISPENYIFSDCENKPHKIFPNIDEACKIVENIVPSHQARYNLEEPITSEQRIAHQLLLDIRQAIQTAMYIANDKSSYNIGYVLPASVSYYLGGIVVELTAYDTKLSTLCKDPRFGATPEDTYRDEQWSTISKIAAGTLVAAAVVGGGLILAPAGTVGAIATKASSLASGTAGLISSLWSGKELLGPDGKPILGADGKPMLSGDTTKWDKFKNTSERVFNAGSAVATIGGGVAFTSGIAQMVDNSGYVSLNQLDPNARYYVDIANKVSSNVATIGGAGMALGSIEKAITTAGTSYQTLKNSENIRSGIVNTVKAGWNTGSVPASTIAAGFSVYSGMQASKSLAATAAQIAGIEQIFGLQQAQPKNGSQPDTTQQNPAVILFTGFSKLIAQGKQADGIEPIEKIITTTQKLLQNGHADPALLIYVFQNLQQTNSNNIVLVEQLDQIIQNLAQLTNQESQAAQQ